MNFLAHLWLADQSTTSLPGAVLGDVVRGRDLSAYPDDMAIGIQLHRRVDAATDRHAIMLDERRHYCGGTRRYAGIVLDIVADFVLATHWSKFHEQSLEQFADAAGSQLEQADDWFLLAGGKAPQANQFSNLLKSYSTESGIEHALARVASRMRSSEPLISASRNWQDSARRIESRLPDLLHDLLEVMTKPSDLPRNQTKSRLTQTNK